MNLFNSTNFKTSEMIDLLKSISNKLYQHDLDDSVGIGGIDDTNCKVYQNGDMYRFSIEYTDGVKFYDYNQFEKDYIFKSLNMTNNF